MSKITLKAIKCYDTEDIFQKDELRLKIFVDGVEKQSLDKKIEVGQTWHIGKKYFFQNHIMLRLYEKDPGPDDFLGHIHVGTNEQTDGNQEFHPSPFSKYKLTYEVDDGGVPPIEKKDRVLLVASELSLTGDYVKLYEFLEANVEILPKGMLQDQYRELTTISGSAMNSDSFVTLLKNLVENNKNRAVDVILGVHGLKEKLRFANGEMITADNLCGFISQAIPGQTEKNRLRMLYSTACYGASHADNFVSQAGFKVACGAKAVNANSAVEYPTFLVRWGNGKSFDESLDIPTVVNHAQDLIAKMVNHEWNVNSTKYIVGDEDCTISTPYD